jgi:2-polyprenyl-3-methyl-5-hydroxy-6-metoxy-1,4-benzoquinol methylase
MREKVISWVPDSCKQFLQIVFRSRVSPPEDCAPVGGDGLPYSQTLKEFEASGKILKRENIYGSGPPSPVISEEVLGYVRQYAGQRILDIGCGIGPYMKNLTSAGYECNGIEVNSDYVAECLKSGLKVQRMDARELRFAADTFDTAMMIEVLEHVSEPMIVLREAFRVAKKNVLISVPNIEVLPMMSKYEVVPWHILEATHVNFFTPKILKSVLNEFAARTEVFSYGAFASWITEQSMHMHIFGVGWKDPASKNA